MFSKGALNYNATRISILYTYLFTFAVISILLLAVFGATIFLYLMMGSNKEQPRFFYVLYFLVLKSVGSWLFIPYMSILLSGYRCNYTTSLHAWYFSDNSAKEPAMCWGSPNLVFIWFVVDCFFPSCFPFEL